MGAALLIGVSGYARSGKDTFAAALVEGRGYQQRSFAEPLRQMLYAQNPIVTQSGLRLQEAVDAVGWEEAKRIHEVRRLLQALGTEAGRKILGENIWVDAAMRGLHSTVDPVVFSDVRFPNEAQAIAEIGGVIVRIERDGVEALNGHATEVAMDDWSFDFIIRNNGTVPDLRQQAFDVHDKLLGKFTAKRYQEAALRHSMERLENGRTLNIATGTTMFTVDL